MGYQTSNKESHFLKKTLKNELQNKNKIVYDGSYSGRSKYEY